MAIINYGGITPNTIGTGWRGETGQRAVLDPDVSYQSDAQKAIASERAAADTEQARIAADAARYAASYAPNLQQARFQAVFPWMQSQVSSALSGAERAGGQSGPSPEITVGGVYNPQQIQQQVNAQRGTNDQTAASQVSKQGQSLAGRGFGSNSPLLQALSGQTMANNLATNTSNEREIRWNAAQGNAQHLLGTQTARENQFANRMREDIERRKPYFQMANTLLGSVAGLV